MSEKSKKSFFTEKVKKMNEFADKNPWIKFFLWFPSLKEMSILIWKALVWIYKKFLSDVIEEIWKRIKEINRNKNINFFIFVLFLLLVVVAFFLFRKQICSKSLTKTKDDLKRFGRTVSGIIEKLKERRGGNLNKSVLLYQVGSIKYGYNKLVESRQKDVYWLFRTNQEDEWTDRQIIRERLVDQVSRDFNLKRDEKKIRKYFRSTWKLESELKWINEEIEEIMLKNPLGERSKEEQERLDELFANEKRLGTELYYSKKFFIVY
jgi:hypothetical protein